MKTLTNTPRTGRYTTALLLIGLVVSQFSLFASEIFTGTEIVTESEEINNEILEDWMLDLSTWTNYKQAYLLEEDVEKEMEIEDWMMDLSTWANYKHANLLEEDVEKEMEVEDWMMDLENDFWKNYQEEEIELEEWMCNYNNSFWNDDATAQEQEMPIEEWMTEPSSWISHNDFLYLAAY
ncbi:hypothetical protein ES705_08176 [subsurface metagenome]